MNNAIVPYEREERIIAENDTAIRKRDGSKVFPIPVPTRNKLEALRDESIGDLRTRFRFIKDEKYNEYIKLNKKRVNAIKEEVEKKSKLLTAKAHKIMIDKRRRDAMLNDKLKAQAKAFYKDVDSLMDKFPELIKKYENWDFPLRNFSKGEDAEGNKMQTEWEAKKQETEDKKAFSLSVDENAFNYVLKKEFYEKYGKQFRIVEDKINTLGRQFNESIMFGDLETVKQVYFNMKGADNFLTELSNLALE